MTYQATAEIFEYIDPDEAVQVAAPITPRLLADILDQADPDVAADVLRGKPDEQTAQTIEAMTESREVIPLLEYADDTAGGLMNPEYLAVSKSLTAVLALDAIRIRARDAEVTSYALVVDEDERLVGHAAIVDVALARDDEVVANLVADDMVSVSVDTDQEECARIMQRYNVNELPVVDADGVLRGIIHGRRRAGRAEGRGDGGHVQACRGWRRGGVWSADRSPQEPATVAGRQPGDRVPGRPGDWAVRDDHR